MGFFAGEGGGALGWSHVFRAHPAGGVDFGDAHLENQRPKINLIIGTLTVTAADIY